MNISGAADPTFTHLHILLTAAITAVLALGAALWRLPRARPERSRVSAKR